MAVEEQSVRLGVVFVTEAKIVTLLGKGVRTCRPSSGIGLPILIKSGIGSVGARDVS